MRQAFILKISFACILFAASLKLSAQTITISRQSESADCTTGYLSVNGLIICHTLEGPEYASSKNKGRIRVGSYRALISTDNTSGWRIVLQDVPGRGITEIYLGNYLFETTGSVLVGSEANVEHCMVENSLQVIETLKSALQNIGPDLGLEGGSSQSYSLTVVFK